MNKTIEALKRVEVWVESLTGLHTDVRQEQGEILAAIREALAEPDWYEEAMRLGGLNAKHVGELKQLRAETVKQEPVAVVEITYGREPECYVTGNIDDFPEGVFKLYAAPVRTKDLTDDEAQKLWNDTSSIVPMWAHHLHFARAVIAAFKEKNK